MLFRLLQFLPYLLLLVGLVLGVGGLVLRIVRRDKLTPRAKGQVFFWGSVGFWSLVIGGFMFLEQLIPRLFGAQ
jgi:ABC-type transport system involved in cytochrome c biogenesis permease subunit